MSIQLIGPEGGVASRIGSTGGGGGGGGDRPRFRGAGGRGGDRRSSNG